jgi:UDP-N-acetylglucosamine--N-acetylmuramyl-(pentapeptide) pyrophosphoryl-undecaprenol N-acetylglucosamine transferase
MKVVISGGGTGGHLFPAVSVGEQIKRERPDADVLFVGTTNGMEARWFPAKGLNDELFPVHGFTGKDPLTRLRAVSEFLSAINLAGRLLSKSKPDLVVSAGGYASAPIAVAAFIRRVPVVMMEQNTRPGLANRMLWRFARRVCVGFREAAQSFGAGKVEVTGNPVRFSITPSAARRPLCPIQILVLGGSSGAHRLNLGVLKAFNILGKTVIKFAIRHQTGEADETLVADQYRQNGAPACITPFIDDIARALDQADLVIARAGAMTVSEIALAGRAAIFVPYPFHTDHQQQHNAEVISRLGGAVILQDDENLGENLASELGRLTAEPDAIVDMGRRAHQAAITDAAARIAHVCFEIVEHGNARP